MAALILALAALAAPPQVWPHADPAEPFKPAKPLTKDDKERIDADKHFAVAILRINQDRWAEGLQELRDALKKNPKHLPALKRAALAAAQLDRRDEALDYCRRAVALDPKDADRLYLGGIILAATGQDAEALSFLERARDLPDLQFKNPTRYASIREALVELYDKRRAYDLLARTLDEILELVERPDRYNLGPIERRVLGRQRLAYYLKRAEALRKAKKYADAESSLRSLADREPALKKRLLVDVAQVQFEAGKPADALKTLDEHFAFGESNVTSAFETLEKAYKAIGSAEFLPRLERLAKAQPSNNGLNRLLAVKLFEAGEFKRAEETLQRLASDRETIPLLLRTYVKLRNAPMLLRTFGRLLQNRAGDEDVEPILAELVRDRDLLRLVAKEAVSGGDGKANVADRERLLDLVAQLAYQAGQFDEAAALYRKCLEISPQAREHHWRLALALLRADKFAETIKAADAALAIAPDDVDVYELKASAMAQLGKTAEAVKMLEELAGRTKNAEQTIEVRLAIAGAYQQGKNLSKAAEIYRTILGEMGDSTEAHRIRYLLSGVYSQLNENKKAEEELLKIIDANPRPPERIYAGANNDLGYLWVDAGRNLDRAEQMIRVALRTEPDNPAYLDSLGWALFKRGRFQEAKDNLRRAATARAGDDPVVWEHLGEAHHRLGETKEALEAWRTAIRLYEKGAQGTTKEKAELLRGKVDGLHGKGWETKTRP
jgi:tetratricopeptide (TPR) repeat protein